MLPFRSAMEKLNPEALRVFCCRFIGTALGLHTHVCPSCSWKWTHHGLDLIDATKAQHEAAHTCKKCGAKQYECAPYTISF